MTETMYDKALRECDERNERYIQADRKICYDRHKEVFKKNIVSSWERAGKVIEKVTKNKIKFEYFMENWEELRSDLSELFGRYFYSIKITKDGNIVGFVKEPNTFYTIHPLYLGYVSDPKFYMQDWYLQLVFEPRGDYFWEKGFGSKQLIKYFRLF